MTTNPSSSNMQLEPELKHHDTYYYPKGSHVFRVENTLYKLHEDLITIHSTTLRDLFVSGAHAPHGDGQSDENAIVLYDRAEVFNLFLDLVYNSVHTSQSSYTSEDLRDLLGFVDKYNCSPARQFVVGRVWEHRFSYHPAELIQLSCEFKLEKPFKWSFNQLLELPLTEIHAKHRLLMGHEIFVPLIYVKAILDKHRRLIAAEEPTISNHAEDCRNPRECADDWHAAWWNGMGRFLLDGRNPQPYRDAVNRFKEMKFGRMSAGCRVHMLHVVDLSAGFKHAERFIEEICQGLVDEMHISEDTFNQS